MAKIKNRKYQHYHEGSFYSWMILVQGTWRFPDGIMLLRSEKEALKYLDEMIEMHQNILKIDIDRKNFKVIKVDALLMGNPTS